MLKNRLQIQEMQKIKQNMSEPSQSAIKIRQKALKSHKNFFSYLKLPLTPSTPTLSMSMLIAVTSKKSRPSTFEYIICYRDLKF